MKKKTLLFICAIVTFVLGICAVFVWFNLKKNHTTTTKPVSTVIEKYDEINNFPGFSKEINAIEKGKSGYFPKDIFAREEWEDQDDFMNDCYGKHLKASNEKSLLDISDKNLEVYRLTWLRSFHHPIIVRVEKQEDKFVIVLKELGGAGGYEPGKVIKDKETSINKKDWRELNELLNDIDYWGMKTDINDGDRDGAQWILEGVKENRYHIVDRYSPRKGNYRELGLFMLKLSGFDLDENKDDLY